MHEDRLRDEGRRDAGGGIDEGIFRSLREAPGPEVDGERLWRRLRAALPPRRAAGGAWAWRPGLAAAAAAAAVGALALGLWLWGPATAPGPRPPREAASVVEAPIAEAPASEAQAGALVLLADAGAEPAEGPERAPAAESPPEIAAAAALIELRLYRAYEGAPPADALPAAALGVGGADAAAEARRALAALLPERELAIVGQWSGPLPEGAADVRLSARHAMRFELRGGEAMLLRDVLLQGEGAGVLAQELSLEPGRLYLFGVRAAHEDEEQAGRLVLGVRVRAPAQ